MFRYILCILMFALFEKHFLLVTFVTENYIIWECIINLRKSHFYIV